MTEPPICPECGGPCDTVVKAIGTWEPIGWACSVHGEPDTFLPAR